MKINNLRSLLIHELQDIYDAEHRIHKELESMEKSAHANDVKELFKSHREETQGQIERLEKTFELLGEKAQRTTCEATKGLIEEAKELLSEIEDDATSDAALIAAAQKVEHYEIASYGTVAAWAHILDQDQCSRLLNQTLEEEKSADKKLMHAASKLNLVAL
ncbi:MAG: ferritin-like domain-containing protein [Opitutales bacterium]